MITFRWYDTLELCGGVYSLYGVRLVRTTEQGDELLGYMRDRCVAPHLIDRVELAGGGAGNFGGVSFDDKNGKLLVTVSTSCWSDNGLCPGDYDRDGTPDSDDGTYAQVMSAIVGFATTFEVLQTYMPQPPSLGFRVPYMPEGMAGADSFDTYWGALTKPLDFTQAHGLQCDYPAAASHVGDYLAVADTVPTPAPGQGVYYVTSATYQGATRYGRKATNGQLTGRDPTLLPACTP